ncbi:MAG: hypothetical protein WDW38_010611 [Sanguina aurantia]
MAMFTLEGNEPPALQLSQLDLELHHHRLTQQQQYNATSDGLHNIRHQQESPVSDQAGSGGFRGQHGAGSGSANAAHTAGAGSGSSSPRGQESFFFPHTVPQFYVSADTPVFFQSTKFFACLDVEEAKELFNATYKLHLKPNQVLFRKGDQSESGIFIVVHGTLGVFLESHSSIEPTHANTLRYGESVGDLDVVDGALRSVTCIALEQGCMLVQVSRSLFMDFIQRHPRALLLYLQQVGRGGACTHARTGKQVEPVASVGKGSPQPRNLGGQRGEGQPAHAFDVWRSGPLPHAPATGCWQGSCQALWMHGVSCRASHGIARLWRVAHFVLDEFLQLELHREGHPSSSSAAPAALRARSLSPTAPASKAGAAAATQCDAETQTYPDGMDTAFHPDGMDTAFHPDGMDTEFHPDGMDTEFHPDGSNAPSQLPSGSASGSSYEEEGDGSGSSDASLDPMLDLDLEPSGQSVPRARALRRLQRSGSGRGPCIDAVTGTYRVPTSGEQGGQACDGSASEPPGEPLAAAPRPAGILASGRSSGLGDGALRRLPRRSPGPRERQAAGAGPDGGAAGRVCFDVVSPIAAAAVSPVPSPACGSTPVGGAPSTVEAAGTSPGGGAGPGGGGGGGAVSGREHTGSPDTASGPAKSVLEQGWGAVRSPPGASAPVLTRQVIEFVPRARGVLYCALLSRRSRQQLLLQRAIASHPPVQQLHITQAHQPAGAGSDEAAAGVLAGREAWPGAGRGIPTDEPVAQCHRRCAADCRHAHVPGRGHDGGAVEQQRGQRGTGQRAAGRGDGRRAGDVAGAHAHLS